MMAGTAFASSQLPGLRWGMMWNEEAREKKVSLFWWTHKVTDDTTDMTTADFVWCVWKRTPVVRQRKITRCRICCLSISCTHLHPNTSLCVSHQRVWPDFTIIFIHLHPPPDRLSKRHIFSVGKSKLSACFCGGRPENVRAFGRTLELHLCSRHASTPLHTRKYSLILPLCTAPTLPWRSLAMSFLQSGLKLLRVSSLHETRCVCSCSGERGRLLPRGLEGKTRLLSPR